MIVLPTVPSRRVPADAPPALYLMTEADYHADPCPDASLTQSCAKTLVNQSAAHAWTHHVRLNPEYEVDDDTKYDIGNIAHTLMLGRGRVIMPVAFDNWRTNAAKDARDAAAAVGQLAVLQKHYQLAEIMIERAHQQLAALPENLTPRPFQTGAPGQASEIVAAWREHTIWLRCMIDSLHVSARGTAIDDYKTTELSASPLNLDRMMVTQGWDIQAAMAERALRAIEPNLDRPQFRFIVQENYPPFALVVYLMTESVLTMGRKKLQHAVNQWTEAMLSGKWPSYPSVVHGEYPAWAETSWLNREITEAAL